MNKVLTKPNDIFIATFNAPEATPLELLKNNITAENTTFLNEEEYRQTPFVQKRFTNDKGVFLEEEFKKVYQKAKEKYEDLADQMSYEGLILYIEYDKDNVYRPATGKIKDTTPTFSYVGKQNPLGQQLGVEGIGVVSDPIYSEKEKAQLHAVWDTDNKRWLDYTAEDLNLLRKLFGQTLKYAKYLETGELLNPITNKIEYHEKGEWMTDENGQYFTATMGSQLKGFDEVVAVSDILTKESSKINKFDFWDSDGIDKSLGGIAMKTFVSLLPYLTPLRGYYGAFSAITGLMGSMPIIYKSLESLILGENQTNMTEGMTAFENWFYKWDSNASKSKKGSKSFWTVESIGQLVADTFGLLYQQRAAAKLAPKILKRFDTRLGKIAKYNELTAGGTSADEAAKLLGLTAKDIVKGGKELNKVASTFSTAYMGIVHTSDMYNQTINAGYDRRVAGLTALASMSALFGIMKFNAGRNGLGTWFLDKTTGFNEHVTAGAVLKIAFAELKVLLEALRKAVKSGDKKAMAYAIREWKRKGAEALHLTFVIGGEDIWKGMIVEGVEEVTEEVVQDTIKGIVDTVQWLGWTSTPEASFGGWSNVFSKQGLERYLATFVGGAIGGGIFKALDKWINPFVDSLFTAEPTSKNKEDIYTISRLIIDGRFDEYIKALDKGRKYIHNALDSSTLGNGEVISTKEESQADVLIKLAKAKAYGIKTLLEASVGNFDSLTDFQKEAVANHMSEILEEYGFALDYLNSLFADAAAKVAELTDIYNGLKEIESPTEALREEINKAKDNLLVAVDHFKNFFTGANFNMSMIEGKLLSRPDLIKGLMYEDVEDYAADVYGVNYSELLNTNPLKLEISDSYNEIRKGITKENLKQTLPAVSNVLVKLLERTGGNLKKFTEISEAKEVLRYIEAILGKDRITIESLIKRITTEELLMGASPEEISTITTALLEDSLDGAIYQLAQVNPELFSILPKHYFDLFGKIKSQLEFVGINEELKKILQEMINDLAMRSHVQKWTPKHIIKLISTINNQLAKPNNPYARTMLSLADEGEVVTPEVSLKNNGAGLDDDIKTSSIASLLDFINDANLDYIDAELKERLLTLATKLLSPLRDLDRSIDKYLLNKDLTAVEKLAGVFNDLELAQSLEGDDSYDFVKKLVEAVNAKQVLHNPIIDALKTFYKYLNGTTRGLDIFDWMAEKNNTYSNVPAGLDRELTNVDKTAIKNARRAINVLATVINASTETFFDTSNPSSIISAGGIIDYAREYARFMNLDTSKFWTMTVEEANAAIGYLNDLMERLEDYELLDESRAMSKHGADRALRKSSMIGMAHVLFEKELKIGDATLVGKLDIPEDERECEKLVEKRLEEIRTAYLAWAALDKNNDIKAFIELLSTLFDLGTDIYHLNLASKLLPWDVDTKAFVGDVDRFYVFKRMILTAIVDRVLIQKDIKEILQVGSFHIYPKFDQLLALEELLYATYDFKNKTNVMNTFLDVFNNGRPVLYNMVSLLGTAGSGKSFVMQIIKNKLSLILEGAEFTATSATNKNLSDIKTKLDIDGKLIKDFLNDLSTGLGDLADTVNDLFIELASLWFLTLDENKKGNSEGDEEYFLKIFKAFDKKIKANKDLKTITVAADYDAKKKNLLFTIPISGGGSITLVSQFTSNPTGWGLKNDLRYAVQEISTDILKGIKLNKNIVADEVTLLSPILVKILSDLAKANNKLLITAGDYRLLALLAKAGDVYSNLSPFLSYTYLSAPAFVGSYRFSNNLLTNNLNAIILAISTAENYVIPVRVETSYSSTSLKKLTSYLAALPLSWQVIKPNNNKVFIGHKIDLDLAKFTADLSSLILDNIKEDLTLAVIVESDADRDAIDTILKNSNKIDVDKQVVYIDSKHVLGGEYDYAVVYNSTGYKTKFPGTTTIENDTELNVLKAYTLLSRSTFGTLVYDKEDGLFSITGLSSNENPSTDGYLYADDEESATQNRIAVIDELIRYLTNAPVPAPTKAPSGKADEGDDDGDDDDDKSKEKPKSSPSTEPQPEVTELFDDSKSALEYFNDASILQTWYNRVGIDKNALKLPISTHPVTLTPGSELEDLDAFIALGLVPRSARTLADAADAMLMYKLKVLIDLCDPKSTWYKNSHNSPHLRYKRITASQLYDYAYRKINDLTDWDSEQLFKLILIEIAPDCWLTLGKLGYNMVDEDTNASLTEESLFTNNTIEDFYLIGDESQEVTDYLDKRRVDFAGMMSYVGVPGLIRQTNLRDLWVDKYNDLNWDAQYADLRLVDVKYNRIMLHHLIRQGYRIKNDIDSSGKNNAIWDPKDRTDIDEFIKWYKKYNYFTPSNFDALVKEHDLHKKVWVAIHLADDSAKSQFTKPIMLNRIREGDFLEGSSNATNLGNTKEWAARLIGRFVLDVINTELSLEEEKALKTLRKAVKYNLPSMFEAIKADDSGIYKKAFVKAVLSVNATLLNTDIEADFDSLVDMLIKATKDSSSKPVEDNVKWTLFLGLESLRVLTGSELGLNYFYENPSGNITLTDLSAESGKWVATRFVEPMNFYINWSRTTLAAPGIKITDIDLAAIHSMLGDLDISSEEELDIIVNIKILPLAQKLISQSILDKTSLATYLSHNPVYYSVLTLMNDTYDNLLSRIKTASTSDELGKIEVEIKAISTVFKEAISSLNGALKTARDNLSTFDASLLNDLLDLANKSNGKAHLDVLVDLVSYLIDNKDSNYLSNLYNRKLIKLFLDDNISTTWTVKRSFTATLVMWGDDVFNYVISLFTDRNKQREASEILSEIINVIKECL